MKRCVLVLMLLVCAFAKAQKVDVYDLKGKLLTPKPVEKKDVPNVLKDVPNGEYILKEVNPTKINGKYYFKNCTFYKDDNLLAI